MMPRRIPRIHALVTDRPKFDEWPEDGVACCMGLAAVNRCTCWEPVHDIEQQACKPDLQPQVRDGMCADCACRKDSPEHTRPDEMNSSIEGLHRLVEDGMPFFCHDGMRRPIGYRHPDGRYIESATEHTYDPPHIGDVPYRTNGSPAYICAGWAALREKAEGDT